MNILWLGNGEFGFDKDKFGLIKDKFGFIKRKFKLGKVKLGPASSGKEILGSFGTIQTPQGLLETTN